MFNQLLECPVVKTGGQNVSGMLTGTIVFTLDGELPVESLSPGDRVITRDSGMAILREVRRTKATFCPIRIKAGSLGHTRPERDMVLPSDTLIHIRDWRAEALYGSPTALVPAHKLLDGEFVSRLPDRTEMAFELVFDEQHIIYADGIELATADI
ncbi:hypothetical protein HCZ30_09370 [Marivivens donghaensis]|uniref:Hedgehog/Intein (Hint) domain-containing protein n=2 Tax=Marivivens donghaensis TaxID=1699413 RepID=A0ABX0VX34_9RHOB|nr:hypothetical protein [Marivivens donghaensis]